MVPKTRITKKYGSAVASCPCAGLLGLLGLKVCQWVERKRYAHMKYWVQPLIPTRDPKVEDQNQDQAKAILNLTFAKKPMIIPIRNSGGGLLWK